MVSQQDLIKFKQLYYLKYHIHLTDQEAMKQATAFLNLMQVILSPTKKKQQPQYENTNA